MGVKGLSSLLKDYSQIYQDIRFRDSKLLVDGTNLAYNLYDMANLDQNHGGEYLAYQVQIQALFKALIDCEIKAYVVIDGGSGTSDIKLDTRMDRQRARLENIPAALKGKKMGIFPPSIMSVFEQTLNDMKVPLVKCFGEADGQLAALAKEWSFPVLSGDTDFFIYALPKGVLPLHNFQWDSVKRTEASSYIPCKLYTTSSFCTFFNINDQLLPVFASLAWNDYVNLRDESTRWAGGSAPGRPTMPQRASRLEGLLSWLGARNDRTTEDTLTAAMADMSQQARREVQKSMLEYRLPSSSLRGFFSEGTVPPLPAELSWVPEWVRASLTRGGLGADILMHRRKILRIQVESSNLKSSNLTSRPIRQVLYGVLLAQGGAEMASAEQSDEKLAFSVVSGRCSTAFADRTVRLRVCLETLGVEEETLEGVPAHLRLPVAVTCYWLRRASPEPRLLKALLMVVVQGELMRQIGTAGWQGYTNHHSQPLDGIVAHRFNQWQACLKDASQLNLLLCKPLPEPHYAW
uniref:Asteroid homolog 1 n=1 Tax=Gadus morhua TaxID=8049 RepID=A0A8C5AA21_GADMO